MVYPQGFAGSAAVFEFLLGGKMDHKGFHLFQVTLNVKTYPIHPPRILFKSPVSFKKNEASIKKIHFLEDK